MARKRCNANRQSVWFCGFEFEPRDLWLGVYWERSPNRLDLWICLIPVFPLHITRLDRLPTFREAYRAAHPVDRNG